MGLCISSDANPVPASASNGVVSATIGNYEINIAIPAIGSQVFDKQVNMIHNAELFCYLFNDKYKMYLWYDNMGLIATLDNYIVKPFNYVNPLKDIKVSYKHCGYLITGGVTHNLYLFNINDDNYVMCPLGYPLSCTLSLKDNKSFIYDMLSEYPMFILKDDKLHCVDAGGNTLYEIVGEVSVKPAMITAI